VAGSSPADLLAVHPDAFSFGVLMLPFNGDFRPKGPRSRPPLQATGLSLELARTLAVEQNRSTLARGKRSWSCVVWCGGGAYGLVRADLQEQPFPEAPDALPPAACLAHAGLTRAEAAAIMRQVNGEIYRHAITPRTWAVVVRDMRAADESISSKLFDLDPAGALPAGSPLVTAAAGGQEGGAV
jgi:hypothetical protein